MIDYYYLLLSSYAALPSKSFNRTATPEDAAQLLIELGYWKTSPTVVRTFTAEQRAASLKLAELPQETPLPNRRDLTGGAVFAFRDGGVAVGTEQVRVDSPRGLSSS